MPCRPPAAPAAGGKCLDGSRGRAASPAPVTAIGRDAPHIAPDAALGREASPGQATGINREHGHFPTASLRSTDRKVPPSLEKTNWPETASNCLAEKNGRKAVSLEIHGSGIVLCWMPYDFRRVLKIVKSLKREMKKQGRFGRV